MLKVFELVIKVYLIKEVNQKDSHNIIADFIDSFLAKKEAFSVFHHKNIFKFYSFDAFFPIAQNGIYAADSLYQFRIRTTDKQLADYLAGGLADHQTIWLKGLTRSIRVIPPAQIESVYTITPLIIKDPDGKGYWKDGMSFDKFEDAIRSNLIKKYNSCLGTHLDENFELYNQIELLSKTPIGMPYKGITLLGDKVSIQAADNRMAQELWYFALGTGLGTMNSRGMGFLQYHFVQKGR